MDEGSKVILISVISSATNEEIQQALEGVFIKENNLFPTENGEIKEIELMELSVQDEEE